MIFHAIELRESCREHKWQLLELAVIIAFGLVPLSWFKSSLIAGGDVFWPIHPLLDAREYSSAWIERHGLGSPGALYVNLSIPYLSFWAVARCLGMSLIATEQLWVTVLFSGAGLSMWYFVRVVLRPKSVVFTIVASIFYMYNPYVLIHYAPPSMLLLSYDLIPVVLGLYIRGLETDDARFIAKMGLSSLLLVSAGVNPASYSMPWFAVLSYFGYCIATDRRKIRSRSLYTAKLLVVVVLCNLFWLSMIFLLVGSEQYILAPRDVNWLTWTSAFASLANSFRLFGSWTFPATAYDVLYFPYYSVFLSPPFVFLSLLFTVAAFIPLVTKSRTTQITYVALLGLFAIFLAKGVQPPFGKIYEYLYLHFPAFSIFREPWNKFEALLAFSYAILIGFSASLIDKKLRYAAGKRLSFFFLRLARRSFPIVVISLILLNAWPIATGDVVPEIEGTFNDRRVQVPAYWDDVSNWINRQDGDWRVLLLPQNPFYQVHYEWGYYGVDIAPYFISKPLVSAFSSGYIGSSYGSRISDSFGGQIGEMNDTCLKSYLAIMNVRYILHRKDLDWTQFNTTDVGSPSEIGSKLGNKTCLQLERSFKLLDVYSIKSYEPRHIYAASRLVYIDGNLSAIMPALHTMYCSVDSVYAFSDHILPDIERSLAPQATTFIAHQDALDFASNVGWKLSTDGTMKTMSTDFSEWPNATISYDVHVPKTGLYEVLAFARSDGCRGALQCKIDDGPWTAGLTVLFGERGDLEPHRYEAVVLARNVLSEGYHRISLMNCLSYDGLPGQQNVASILLAYSEPRNQSMKTDLTYEKIDSTKYVIHVRTDRPFFLVFSQSYDPNWIAYIGGTEVAQHFVANGYANGWYMGRTGSYDMTLEFWPQKLFHVSATVSVVTSILCMAYLAMRLRKDLAFRSRRTKKDF